MKELTPQGLRDRTIAYIESMRLRDGPYGRYHYAEGMPSPVLYASTYAAMTLDLFGELGRIGKAEHSEWVAYLQSHQDDDGLFRDPAIFGQGWYEGDPEWCGRRHLSCHVVTALLCLGAVAQKPQRWLEPFYQPGALELWLVERNWADPAFVGNEVMNVGTLLQYTRDFQAEVRAADAMMRLQAWLRANQLDERSGLWGNLEPRMPLNFSNLVMAAYHLWPLFLYDRQQVPAMIPAIDSVLCTQNPRGGFGWGVHNQENPWNSSACEDIDSIDPLARFVTRCDHRRPEVTAALQRALAWVLSNRNPDGGFSFMRGVPFSYGHPLMSSAADVSAMFPTWFRTLSLAILGKALPDSVVGAVPWHFCDCPGMQFWEGQRRPMP